MRGTSFTRSRTSYLLVGTAVIFGALAVADKLRDSWEDRPPGAAQNDFVVFVTTNRHPYNLHLAPILSLPSGLSYRFRYSEQSVRLDASSLHDFAAKPCIVVLSTEPGSYIPLRLCTVKNVQDYGDIFFFDLQVGRLVDYRDGCFGAYNALVTERVYRGSDYRRDGKYVLRVDSLAAKDFRLDNELVPEDSRKIWTETARHLGELEGLETVAFFRFTLESADGVVNPVGLDALHSGYRMTSGQSYRFDIFEYVGGLRRVKALPEPFDFSMEADSTLLSPLKTTEHVDGLYDRFDLIFRTAQILMSTETYVILRSKQTVSGSQIPIVYVPIEISNSWCKKAIAILGVPACIVFFLVPGLALRWASRLYEATRLDALIDVSDSAVSKEMVQGLAVVLFLMILANWDFSSFVTALREKIRP